MLVGTPLPVILSVFDTDFGELVYRRGLPPACGLVLFQLAIPSPVLAADRTLAVLQSRTDWQGQFAVVEERRVRLRPLPGRGPSPVASARAPGMVSAWTSKPT
jgi:hypothetical protein